MSVTFSPTPILTGRYHVEGYRFDGVDDTPTFLYTFATYEEYRNYVEVAGGREAVWQGYDWFLTPEVLLEDAPEVNLSNSNARELLILLCLSNEELVGAEGAGAFADRVRRALALYEGGDGRPASEERLEGGARWIDCGREEGYFGGKLAALLEVALFAEELGLEVQWC